MTNSSPPGTQNMLRDQIANLLPKLKPDRSHLNTLINDWKSFLGKQSLGKVGRCVKAKEGLWNRERYEVNFFSCSSSNCLKGMRNERCIVLVWRYCWRMKQFDLQTIS
jgi:hypothetical protein